MLVHPLDSLAALLTPRPAWCCFQDSVAELLPLVDCVFLETRDGRPRLEQAAEVLRAGKPLFMDKPVAGNLADVLAIYAFAEGLGVPIMSSCPLRFAPVCAAARAGEYGQVLGADVFSPAHLEEEISNVGGFGHVDFYWHAVHGIEALFAAMGRGCTSVSRTTAGRSDVCVARWDDGRTATYRGIHSSPMSRMDVPLPDEPGAYGGTLVTTKGDQTLGNEGLNPRSSLPALLDEVIQFFRSGQPAVTAAETIEMYAFMAACDESKVRGGAEVTLEEVLGPAKQRAQVVLDRHWYKPATYHGRNRLGPPPALAIVNDTRAARVTAEAIIAHHGAGLDQEAVLAEPTLARNGIGVEIDWNGTLSDGPNHPGVPQSWWKSLAAKDAEAHVEEEEAEAAVESEE